MRRHSQRHPSAEILTVNSCSVLFFFPTWMLHFSELIRNKTLDFFSSTLPVLKEDRNLPKVAKYEDFDVIDRRGHRQTDDSE